MCEGKVGRSGPTGRMGLTPDMKKAGLTGYEDTTLLRDIADATGVGMIVDLFDDSWGYERYGRRKDDKNKID